MSALKSIMSWGLGRKHEHAPMDKLFTKTDPAADGEECLQDCQSCSIRYPRNFKVDEDDNLYAGVKGWSTHLIVGTGKTDWVRDVTDEKGSVMEAVGKASAPENGVSLNSGSEEERGVEC